MRLLSSLTNRIFLASALLTVLSIAVAVYVVNITVTSQAERELEQGLEEAGGLVEQYRSTLFQHFAREARLIADLPVVKATVDLDHPPTAKDMALHYQRTIESDVFVVTNRQGGVLAEIGISSGAGGVISSRETVRGALQGHETAGFWPRQGGILQVVSVPIWIGQPEPEILGTLSVGFTLDERVAAQFKSLTASDIAFAVDGVIQAATLPADHHGQLAALLGARGISSVILDDNEYVAVARSLSMDSQGLVQNGTSAAATGPTAPPSAPVALILRSRTEQLRFLDRLHTALAVTALLAVLGATLLSYLVARTVTQPLEAITRTMREMAATGDLTRKIPEPGGAIWEDEDARLLAGTFNTMTESIARFQREASQRERLSSLGRLSTVIAHEIRNPLMIIKAALRSVKRPEARRGQIEAAVADIEEEVTRLNRIVSEVLDFARPIRFEHSAVALNALCRDAAQATQAAEPRVAIEIDADPRIITIVTDGERLRLALINILGNARDAVLARLDGPEPAVADGSPADIQLRTAWLDTDRVSIVVRDHGTGLKPDDLGRVFEPYFTTKRTGSGLGLAIAKNIIEGLGGTITIWSRSGEGTEIAVELPRCAPPAREHAGTQTATA